MLVLTMLLSVAYIQVSATEGFTQVTIESDASTVVVDGDTYTVVRTVADLAPATKSTHYILANDIDFTAGGKQNPGVGTVDLGATAVLDGNGYGFINFELKKDNDDVGKSGMFAAATDGGSLTVRNLHFGTAQSPVKVANNLAWRSNDHVGMTSVWENVQVYMEQTRADGNPGAFISSPKGTHTFKDVDVYITKVAVNTTNNTVGGFVGVPADATTLAFENCNVYGNISTVNRSGGFIGYVGKKIKATFKNCHNYADITIQGGQGAGGFIAVMREAAGSEVTFENCTNNGVITINGLSNTQNVSGAGGFIGNVEKGQTVVFTNCQNKANIYNMSGKGAYAGGFIGTAGTEDAISNTIEMGGCANIGDIYVNTDADLSGAAGGLIGTVSQTSAAVFTQSGNIGTVALAAATSGKAAIGNLAGSVAAWSATDCYAFGTLVGANATKGVLFGTSGDVTTASGNKYIEGSANGENTVGANTAVTAAQAIEFITTTFTAVTPPIVGENGTPVSAAPALKATQKGIATTTDVRLIATVQTCTYDKVGFKYKINDGQEQTVYADTLMAYVCGTSGSDAVAVTAEQLGGVYVYVYTISGINSGDTVVVTPISEIGETVYTGTAVTLEY